MPEELASDPRYEPPILIITALAYLNGTSRQLCPTRVVPGSFRSGRRPPRDGEDYDLSESTATSWGDKRAHVALAQPGDILLFRSEVWHAGGVNLTEDKTRLCVETAFGARKVSQKFYPYLNFQLAERTFEAATKRQLRLLGEHPQSNYG